MSNDPHSPPVEGDNPRQAYVLLLVPPDPASAEERSAWDISRWPTRPYRPHSESALYSAYYDGIRGSPESIPFDALSLQSTTDSQVSDAPPLTPTHDSPPAGDHRHKGAGPADDEDPYHGQTYRASRAPYNAGNLERRPAVHQLSGDFQHGWACTKYMGYLAKMGVAENRPDGTETLVNVLPDTASSLAWSIGTGYCKIAYYDERHATVDLFDRPPVDSDSRFHTRVRLVGWQDDDGVTAPGHNLLPHSLDFRTAEQWAPFRPEFEMRYADQTHAYLIGRERKVMLNCYDFQSCSMNRVPIVMLWAIAYAVNAKLRHHESDGVLGLNLSGVQDDGGRWQAPNPTRSFLRKFQQRLPGLETDLLVMYFTLRPHPKYNPGKRIQSWIAFNRWPTSEMPAFSQNIPLHPEAYEHNCWSVKLKRIEFQKFDERRSTHITLYGEDFPEGLELLVDSGSSTSELPYRTVDGVHRNVFLNEVPLDGHSSLRTTYQISEDFQMHLLRVRLNFQGDSVGQDVVVYAPFEHFVCARDLSVFPHSPRACPWEGLIFFGKRNHQFGVLGLNFFQTMFISFHKAEDGVNYLRMAPQDRDSLQKYQVPFTGTPAPR